MSLIIDRHREYLRDTVRVDAFAAAVRERVRPGNIIADVGAGTGILGLLACQAGASRVYAIERSGMVTLATEIAAANGFADRIVPVHATSDLARLPEPVDGIVTDQIGHFGFEAGLFDVMADARRFLKPDGWAIPGAIELVLAPIEDAEIRERLAFWSRPLNGLDFSAASEWALNTGYPKALEAAQLLGGAVRVARLECPGDHDDRSVLDLRATIVAERDGLLDAVGGWFVAELAGGVTLSNGPDASPRLTRRNLVLPLRDSIRVQPGDRLDVRVQIRPADLVVSWRVVARTAAGERSASHSTLRGMLMTLDDLRRLAPESVPHLSPRGLARLTVLRLCDGCRALAAIERETYERHRALFRSPADAAVFVAEVVSRYSE